MQQLMQQAKQLNQKMAEVKEELERKETTASAGGGIVEVKVNGKMEIVAVRIDPEIVKEGDVEMIQDLVACAVNEALRKIQQEAQEAMGQVTGGLPIPGFGI